MESTPDTFPSLFAGCLVFWGILGAYLVSLGIRIRRIEKRLSNKTESCKDR